MSVRTVQRKLAPGRFITLEGGEGVGKSTQIARLKDRLEAEGVAVLTTREPGGSPGAEAMRHVLLSGFAKPMGPAAEAMLFAAARLDHLDTKIRPALAAGQWVLCDRFADSTRVYQGALGQVDMALLLSLEGLVVAETRPDLTLILDIDAQKGLARAAARRGSAQTDRFEAENLTAHIAMREAFLAIAREEPARCAIIDADQTLDDVHEAIWRTVRMRLLSGPDGPRPPSAPDAAQPETPQTPPARRRRKVTRTMA